MSKQSSFRVARFNRSLAKAISLALVSTPAFGANRVVLNCGDGGPGSGSLRDIITNVAGSGDTVDLSQLPGTCGMSDSRITLGGGEILVTQNDLTIQGPTQGTVTVSGSHSGRVFNHLGNGQLSVINLTITEGAYNNASGDAAGGCIFAANAYLANSSVTACEVTASNVAKGGGIATSGSLVLTRSNITGNQATSTTLHSFGGGASVGSSLNAKYSNVQGNAAQSPQGAAGQYSNGGGLSVMGNTIVSNSAIVSNQAYQSAAIEMRGGGTLLILDSTISGNTAAGGTSGVWSGSPIQIYNSTVAFNTSDGNSPAVVVGSDLTLQSSIIANNYNHSGPADLAGFGGASVSGANNIVMASTLSLPAGTSNEDPVLGPLQMNGGPTPTHALLAGSPAIGQGNDTVNVDYDQRGRGHPRVTGAALSVDIGAVQFDTIFVGDFEL